MTAHETISVDVDDRVATVTLQRQQALNAITVQMLDDLNEAFDRLAANERVAVVILEGAGRAFSAGVDLKALRGVALDGGMIGDLLDVPARRLTERVSTMGAVVIAKVHGYCFTGALEIAMACDLIVCADDAVFGDTHARWGLRPTWGMSQRLPLLVGLQRARDLSYTARTFTGTEAAEWGLAARAVSAEQLEQDVSDLAATIAGHSTGSLRAYKDLFAAHANTVLREGLHYEATTSYEITDTDERVAGFRN